MTLRFRALAIPLAFLLVTACGDDSSGSDVDAGGADADTADADPTGICGEFNVPTTVLDTYPANFSGDVVGAGGNFDVAAGICLDERSHFAQEGEDQVIRLNNLTPGTDYVVQIDAASDLAFYVATDCSASDLVAGECLLFVDEATGLEAGEFTAPDSGFVFVVVDHFGADPVSDGTYTLSVFEPDCTVDDDCSGTPATPFCSNFTCVACANSFDCSTTGEPVCDLTSNTCVAGSDACTGDDSAEQGDDGPAGATVVTATEGVPGVVSGKICSDPATELDFYKIAVAADEAYVFTLDWVGADDLDLYLFDADGAILDNAFFEQPEVLILAGLAAGDYYVAVGKFESDGTPVAAAVDYTLTVSVPECQDSFDCTTAGTPVCGPALTCVVGPADCTGEDGTEGEGNNDGPAGAQVLSSGVAQTGTICNTPGTEADFFKVTVAQGDSLDVALTYTENGAADLDVNLFDDAGTSLGFTFWNNPENVNLTFLPAGDYFIRVTYFGAEVAVAHPYSLTATVGTGNACTTATDCALEYSTQVFRGNCNAGACEFIDNVTPTAQDTICDSNDDCTSGVCSYLLFQEGAQGSVCTVSCASSSECTTAHGAGFSCTVPFASNFCHPDCTKALECGANPGSDVLDPGEPWDYLTCTAGACQLDP